MKLPPGMKKRLQASIDSLTPAEAGRLYAIYADEAQRKDFQGDILEYPPIKELRQSFQTRVDKSRGKPEEKAAVDAYNAFAFLTQLYFAINDIFSTWAFATVSDAYKVMNLVSLLIIQDAAADIARRVKATIVDSIPKPVSAEDYQALMSWANGDALENLWEAAYRIADEGSEDPEGTFIDDQVEAVYNDLVAKLNAGDLVGGFGLSVFGLWGPVLVKEGKLPAWAALILTWQRFVTGRGFRGYINADFSAKVGGVASRIVDADGQPIDDKTLHKLAGDFYRESRRRPWGKGLKEDPGDLEALAYFLIRDADEFTHVKAPDLGLVDWEAFAKVETDSKGEPFELIEVATNGSLNTLDEDFRHGVTFGPGALHDRFFPSPYPDWVNREFATAYRALNILDRVGQPFTLERKEKGTLTTFELTGFKVLTELEKAVERFRDVRNTVFSGKHAFQTLTDRYFGGLDVLRNSAGDVFEEADNHLETTAQSIANMREKLKGFPYDLETDDFLDPGEPELDEEIVDLLIRNTLNLTYKLSHTDADEADAILFGKGRK
jgi:hypothetical protein